uniref:Uncharacterized protein n=1 Tax=Anguilla anguilla TaxID=7936 RepID=A0A0E9W0Z6_ANGAN
MESPAGPALSIKTLVLP